MSPSNLTNQNLPHRESLDINASNQSNERVLSERPTMSWIDKIRTGGVYPSPPDEKAEYKGRAGWTNVTDNSGYTADARLFGDLAEAGPAHDFPLFPPSSGDDHPSHHVLHANRTIIDMFNSNAAQFLMSNKKELRRYPSANAHLRKRPTVDASESHTIKKRRTVNKTSSLGLIDGGRSKQRTPKSKLVDVSYPLDSAAIYAPLKVRKPSVHRDDNDYSSIPDCCPPISTLSGPKALKVDWKGGVLDLSDDPDRDLLHESELNVAATLRLSCAVYLCSKRRIFQARLHALRIHKEFRKTDAQQACKIDVNKASKLWTVFDKVSWFDPRYMQRYL